jgi:hypothetical protein
MVCNTDEPCAYRGRNADSTASSSSASSSDYGGSYGKWQDDQYGSASAPSQSKKQPQCRMVPAGRAGMVRSCSNDPGITLEDLKDFGTGFWEGSKELATGLWSTANMARECGLSTPVFTDYSACYQHVSAMVTNIKDHPGEIWAKIADTKDWNDHKYWKWAGHLAPTVIGLILTKGAGAPEEAGAEGTAEVVGTASSKAIVQSAVDRASAMPLDELIQRAGFSDAQREALLTNPKVSPMFAGTAIHNVTQRLLDQAYPNRFLYNPTKGIDIFDTLTGGRIEIATEAQAAYKAWKYGIDQINNIASYVWNPWIR